MVEEGEHIVGHLSGAVVAGRSVGLSHSTVVREQAAKLILPDGGVRVPDRVVGGDSHNEQNGLAASAFFVVQGERVFGERRHGRILKRGSWKEFASVEQKACDSSSNWWSHCSGFRDCGGEVSSGVLEWTSRYESSFGPD